MEKIGREKFTPLKEEPDDVELESPSVIVHQANNDEESKDDDGCRICGSQDDAHLIIEPCNCAGSLRKVHTTCLQRWISTRPLQDEEGQANDARMRCEICNSTYRILVTYYFNFSMAKCCLWESMGHVIEILFLFTMLGICIAMWPILRQKLAAGSEPAFGSAATDEVLIPIISGVMVVLTLFTLFKVFRRWTRANSVMGIQPVTAPYDYPSLPIDTIPHLPA